MADGPSIAPKRSLFNKPTWAAKNTSTTTADRPFFDHRDTTYGDILAEKERKREKHRARTSGKTKEASGRESKRRRISSSEDSDSDLRSSRHGDTEEDEDDIQNIPPVTRSTPMKNSDPPASPRPDLLVKSFSPSKSSTSAKPAIIDLGDDEDDAEPPPRSPAKPKKISPSKARSKPPTSDPESEDEDEYMLELKRRAREKARLRKLGLEKSQSRTPEPPNAQGQSPRIAGATQSGPAQSPGEATSHQSPPPPTPPRKEEEDIIVRILIRTAIPDTTDLIVNRRATQNLQQVKEAWCKRQGFDTAKTRKVILTWRGNKLFNTSTCIHILRSLKEERRKRVGVASMDSDEDDGDPSKGKIEVEAVTEEILAERKRAREKEEQAQNVINGDEEQGDEDGGDQAPPKEPEYQLQLSSPGLEPFYLKVRASTLVSKIMAGFRKVREIEHGKTCWLVFDGERLDPDTRIGDTEIEDGDAVDVQIR